MKRRDFLKTGGIVGSAGLILDSCGKPQQLIPLLVSEDKFVPGEEAWVHSVCQQCSAGCGINVRVMQGESIRVVEGQTRRVKAVQAKVIEGNREHPISMGGTCARGQAGVQALYHPDRIQTPLKRTGERGSGQYQPIAWPDAMRLLISEMQRLQATPEALAMLTGRKNRGTIGALLDRFAASFGTPNVVAYDPFDPAPIRKAFELTTGSARLPAVDFANANYLLSFHANLFETFLSPVHYIHSYGIFRQGRPGIRGKFVHAEPRLSQTAACADQWLPIQPGTEGLLALAMARVIVGENLYDRDFVDGSTTGFAEWAAALEHYEPAKVAQQIGVGAETITAVAREFAQRRPSVAVGDSRDVASLAAIYALNALVGAFGKPGGILIDPDLAGAPPAVPGTDLRSLMTAVGANQVKALLVFDTNPLFTFPEADTLKSVLAGMPFIASFSPFLDETAVMADLILPNHHALERWIDDVPEPGVGFPIRTLGRPVVEPRWNTRDTGDVLIEAAQTLGGAIAAALPFENVAAAVKESFRPVHALNAGSIVDSDFDSFFEKVTTAGGWWHPQYEPPAGTAEGKIRFAAPDTAVTAQEFSGDPQRFPYALHVYPSAAFADGRTAHLPWLQEMPDPMTTLMWSSWVEVNPELARRLDIHEGDVLTISSPQGNLELPAYVYPGLRPDVIAIPVGQGHTQYGRYAAGRGANPLRLSRSAIDGATGAVVQTGVRVGVAKTGRTEVLIKFGSSDAHEHPDLHR